MRHQIPVDRLGSEGEIMAQAVGACVHCGFCLSACPTYRVLEQEMDSPRGRIYLMKEVLEENLPLEEALPYIDRCLGCVACVPACPSGVAYGDLVTLFRGKAEQQRHRTTLGRLLRFLVQETIRSPTRFRTAATVARLAHPFRHLIPDDLGAMLDLLPARLPPAAPLPDHYPAEGTRRARVALLSGCAQQVLAPQINWATLRVLARNGVETLIPTTQGCCGALALHTGESRRARALARKNIEAFDLEVDAVLTNAAGCGSGMREYGLLFLDQPEETNARSLASRVKDISAFLNELGIESPPPLPQPLKVAYHDACHLGHAQGVRDAPRRLLNQVPNLELVEIPEVETCCGSAGSYNIEQPEIARELGDRKARAILRTEAEAVATGNIGCLTQIQFHLNARNRPLPIVHTVELLDRAYAATDP